jgi:phosphate transport system substrate-binding protein
MRTTSKVLLSAVLAGVVGGQAKAQVEVDPALPEYTPVQGVSGTIKSIGSDTMNNLMTLWIEGFKEFYPNVVPQVKGEGSSAAPPALIAGTADFGPMSRAMKAEEIEEFEKKFGYKPTQLPTSLDMLAVYVHKDNPIESLTLAQADAIFSKSRKRGFAKDIRTWGDAGVKSAAFAKKKISLYGRNEASGTYVYFKEHTLGKGDFKDSVKAQPGSSSVVQGVASDKFAIGYSGIGYKTADVKAVPLAEDDKSKPVPAEPDYAYTGEYPLSRELYLYLNVKPNTPLDPLRREFIRYVFSRQGQEVVVKDGYFPVTANMAQKALSAIGLDEKSTAAAGN